MPHRFITAPMEVVIAALTAGMAAVNGLDNISSQAIWDKSQLRLWCLLGSIGGAFLAIALLPSREWTGNYTRRLALKFFASGICGLIFTPIAIRWAGWPVDSDVVLAVSATVALVAVGTISALYPIWLRWVIGKAGERFSDDKEDP